MDHPSDVQKSTVTEINESSSRTSSTPEPAASERVGTKGNNTVISSEDATAVDEIEESKKGRFAYFKTRNFYIVLVLG